MKPTFLLIIIILLSVIFFGNGQNTCSFAQNSGYSGPKRLVGIKGKATILNHPVLGETPASGSTLIFQKVGCESCFIGAITDIDGNYEITVGDGKYKIIYKNPSTPDVEFLAPDQERFIDTGSVNSPNRIFNFDIKIKLPK